MNDPLKKGRIDRLGDMLYSRTRYKNPLDKRTSVESSEQPPVGEKWQSSELDELLAHEIVPTPVNPFMKKVFIFSIIFFFGALIVAGFIILGGANFVSSRNVDINILGPATISAGKVLELNIGISNTNNADLELANLSIQYPQGSRNPKNTAESLTFTRNSLGVVKAGSEVIHNEGVVLLGSTGEVKEIKFSVEYKVKGSNATFYKEKTFEVTIGETPATLIIQSSPNVTSGVDFETVVTVVLNANDILKDVILKAEYPYGYSVSNADPLPAADNNIWALGDLSPGEKKKISIRGRLIGENNEQRTFRFYVGVADPRNIGPNLKVALTSTLNTVTIARPPLGLSISLNGEVAQEYVAPAARSVNVVIKYQNNLPDKLLNPILEARLSGQSLDKNSVIVGNNGVYDSGKTLATWKISNAINSVELSPGESGLVSLRFASLPPETFSSSINDIIIDLNFTGIPVDAVGQAPIKIHERRVVKISSQVNLAAKVLRSIGPYANTGPIPPKAGEETTYAVMFNLGNTRNDLLNTELKAQLGPGVTWLSAPSIGGEDVSYDEETKTVTWNVGTLLSETGFSAAGRELSFQVGLTPSVSQIGTTPTLVSGIVLTGEDVYTKDVVTINSPPLTTRLTSDPAFIQGDDIVVK